MIPIIGIRESQLAIPSQIKELETSWSSYIRDTIFSVGLRISSWIPGTSARIVAQLLDAEALFSLHESKPQSHDTIIKARKAFLEALNNLGDNPKFAYPVEHVEAFLEGLDWCELDSNPERTITRLVDSTLQTGRDRAEEIAQNLIQHFNNEKDKILSQRENINQYWVDLRSEINNLPTHLSLAVWGVSFPEVVMEKRASLINLINENLNNVSHLFKCKIE